MRFNNYFTSVLGILGTFPDNSVGKALLTRGFPVYRIPSDPSDTLVIEPSTTTTRSTVTSTRVIAPTTTTTSSTVTSTRVIVPTATDIPTAVSASTKCARVDPVFGCLRSPTEFEPRFCEQLPGFFDPKHFHEAGTGGAYLKWTRQINQDSPEWKDRISEPTFFAQQVLGWRDFDCGISYHGCNNKPTCDEIYTRLDDPNKARQVYFILKSMENLSLVIAVVAEQSVVAQVDLSLMADSIAHNFIWKFDEKVEKKCKLYSALAKAAILSAFVILGSITGGLAAPALAAGGVAAEAAAVGGEAAAVGGEAAAVGGEAAAVGGEAAAVGGEAAAVGEEVGVVAEDASIVGNVGSSAEESSIFSTSTWANPNSVWMYAKDMAYIGKSYAKTHPTKSQLDFANNFASNFPLAVGSEGITQSICSRFVNAPKNLEENTRLSIKRFIDESAQEYRDLVERVNADAEKGVGFGDQGAVIFGDTTVLAHAIERGAYVEFSQAQHRRFVTQPNLIEQDMKAYFRNAVISVLLKDAMCYMQCSYYRPEKPDRTLIQPEPGRWCEAKCWRNTPGETTLDLFGLDELAKPDNEWDLTLQGFLLASYRHYKQHGLNSADMFPTVQSLLEGKQSSAAGSFLPVCDTYYTGALADRKGMSKGLPCACGDQYGIETAAFWNASNFNNWVADPSPGPLEKKPGLILHCRNELAQVRTPPVAYYMNLCNAGWHWPRKWEVPDATFKNGEWHYPKDNTLGEGYLTRGAESCEWLKDWIYLYKRTYPLALEREMNCHFCSSPDGPDGFIDKFLIGDQAPQIYKFQTEGSQTWESGLQGYTYNLKRACELWKIDHYCKPEEAAIKVRRPRRLLNSTIPVPAEG